MMSKALYCIFDFVTVCVCLATQCLYKTGHMVIFKSCSYTGNFTLCMQPIMNCIKRFNDEITHIPISSEWSE